MPPIVLVTVDCLRADHVGCYGYDRNTTPNVDEFAAGAAVFDGYANSPGTRWAIQTVYTGVPTGEVGGIGNPGDRPTLPGVLSDAGYETAAFANNGYFSRHYGYDEGFDRFHDVEVYDAQRDPVARFGSSMLDAVGSPRLSKRLSNAYRRLFSRTRDGADGFATDQAVVDDALDWMASRSDSDFFVWVHLMDAHTPYVYDDRDLAVVGGNPSGMRVRDPGAGDLDDPTHRDRSIRAYDASIRSADEQVGRILDAVDDDAAVAITGDHGEDFGEHLGFHHHSVYKGMSQVPAIYGTPDLTPGRVEAPAQHLDVAPTLATAAGLERPAGWGGRVLPDGTHAEAPVIFELPEMWGVRRGEWKLVETAGDPVAALYRALYLEAEGPDVGADHPDRRDELAALLAAHREESVSPTAEDAGARLDELPPAVRRNLDELGYL